MKHFKTGKRGRLQSDVPGGVCLEHGPGRRPDRWRERHCSEIFFVIRIVRCGEGLEVEGGGRGSHQEWPKVCIMGQMAGSAVGEGMVSLGKKWLSLACWELWDTRVEPSGWLELELRIKAGSHRECKWIHGHTRLTRRASGKGRGPRNPCASEGWMRRKREGRRCPSVRKKTLEHDAMMPRAECRRTNRLWWWRLMTGQVGRGLSVPGGSPRQGSCDLPGSSVSAVVRPGARPYGGSISNHITPLSLLTPGAGLREAPLVLKPVCNQQPRGFNHSSTFTISFKKVWMFLLQYWMGLFRDMGGGGRD